jgi:hypothetical protein
MTERWQNAGAGPRQVKDLDKAVSALTWEGRAHDEVSGVVGGEEHRSSYVNMFGPVRPEVTALDEAIREKYTYQVTKASVRAIIADYEAAVPEARKSRPVKDSRRTPEEDAELSAKVAAREAEYQAKCEEENAVMAQVMAKAPAGAKALIIAELHEDTSDLQSDYHANKTTRAVAIGFRFSSREDFRQLHAAAARFPETADVEFEERRDNYSMGKGNYLSDHGWDGAGSGWVIKSRDIPCKYVSLTEDAIPATSATPPATTAGSGGAVTVSPSSTGREGVVEVRFAEKPAAEVIQGMHDHGFRWARGNRCWYGGDVAYANSLAALEGAAR